MKDMVKVAWPRGMMVKPDYYVQPEGFVQNIENMVIDPLTNYLRKRRGIRKKLTYSNIFKVENMVSRPMTTPDPSGIAELAAIGIYSGTGTFGSTTGTTITIGATMASTDYAVIVTPRTTTATPDIGEIYYVAAHSTLTTFRIVNSGSNNTDQFVWTVIPNTAAARAKGFYIVNDATVADPGTAVINIGYTMTSANYGLFLMPSADYSGSEVLGECYIEARSTTQFSVRRTGSAAASPFRAVIFDKDDADFAAYGITVATGTFDGNATDPGSTSIVSALDEYFVHIQSRTSGTYGNLGDYGYMPTSTGFTVYNSGVENAATFDYVIIPPSTTVYDDIIDIYKFSEGNTESLLVQVKDGYVDRAVNSCGAAEGNVNGKRHLFLGYKERKVMKWRPDDGLSELSSDATVQAQLPKGSVLAYNNTRLFVSGDPEQPETVYYSASYDPSDFSVSEFAGSVIIDGGYGGDIRALVPIGRNMVVFKQNAIYFWYEAGPNGTISRVYDGMGIGNNRSAVVFESVCYFANKYGIFAFNGNGFTEIGQPLRDTFSINPTTLDDDKMFVHVDKEYLYVGIPSRDVSIDSVPNTIFMSDMRAIGTWMKMSNLMCSKLVSFLGNTVGCINYIDRTYATKTCLLYDFFRGDTDNVYSDNQAITSKVELCYDFGANMVEKILRELHIAAAVESSTQDVTFNWSSNNKTTPVTLSAFGRGTWKTSVDQVWDTALWDTGTFAVEIIDSKRRGLDGSYSGQIHKLTIQESSKFKFVLCSVDIWYNIYRSRRGIR